MNQGAAGWLENAKRGMSDLPLPAGGEGWHQVLWPLQPRGVCTAELDGPVQICVLRQVLSVSQADDRNVAPRDSPAASDDSFEMIPDEEESGVQLASTDGAQPCGVEWCSTGGNAEQSAKMGELLLQGWRMMEECCEYGGCPYMEHPVNGRKFSVATGEVLQPSNRLLQCQMTGKYTDEEVEVVQQAPAAAASPITPM